ncbi:hypothetical protein [Amycolatopsis rifamycinica]|uniref:hypothetical protein n=1 Tax=Amycolatopsis rifamycinica TaxID=287986 RepID=UPI00190F8739|nr:hypothetical protein [Amycolatopsis rifamycinica]
MGEHLAEQARQALPVFAGQRREQVVPHAVEHLVHEPRRCRAGRGERDPVAAPVTGVRGAVGEARLGRLADGGDDVAAVHAAPAAELGLAGRPELVNLDGDHAKATANQLVHFFREGEPPHRSSGLRVGCVAARTPGGRRLGGETVALAWTRKQCIAGG